MKNLRELWGASVCPLYDRIPKIYEICMLLVIWQLSLFSRLVRGDMRTANG